MQIIKRSPKALSKAVAALKKGGVIICPTDTVYGFIADAGRKKAVGYIFKIKKRPFSKPLPVFAADVAMVQSFADIDEKQMKRLKKYWPGKYTFVLKRKKKTLFGVAKDTIAIRIPKYPFLNTLLKKIKKPLVQTSVNISYDPPMTSAEGIKKVFGNDRRIALLIDGGDLKKAVPSKVMDLTKAKPIQLR